MIFNHRKWTLPDRILSLLLLVSLFAAALFFFYGGAFIFSVGSFY